MVPFCLSAGKFIPPLTPFHTALPAEIQHLNPAVVLKILPPDALAEDQSRQGLRILSIPAGQQVLKPFVPARVCHPVADHYCKASRLQRGTGHIRSRRPAPQTRRQGPAGDPPDSAPLLHIAGGRAVFEEGRLPVSGLQVMRSMVVKLPVSAPRRAMAAFRVFMAASGSMPACKTAPTDGR